MGDLETTNAAKQAQHTKQAFTGAVSDDPALHDETQAEFEAELREKGPEAVMQQTDADIADINDDVMDDDPSEQSRHHQKKARDETADAERDAVQGRDRQAGFSSKASFDDAAEGGASYQGSKVKDFISYGVKDKGSYYNFDNTKVTDKQLRRMILRGHLDKGWNTLHFYDKKGNIDQQLTQRANNILSSFGNSKSPLLQEIGQKVSVSPVNTSVAPFQKGNPAAYLGKAMENMGRKWSSAKEEWANTGVPLKVTRGIESLIG